ncbi:unnamed protein product, partial [Prunus brigantina]
MKLEIRNLSQKLEAANAKAHSLEREKKILEQEKYESEIKRLDQVQERCKITEKQVTRAT